MEETSGRVDSFVFYLDRGTFLFDACRKAKGDQQRFVLCERALRDAKSAIEKNPFDEDVSRLMKGLEMMEKYLRLSPDQRAQVDAARHGTEEAGAAPPRAPRPSNESYSFKMRI